MRYQYWRGLVMALGLLGMGAGCDWSRIPLLPPLPPLPPIETATTTRAEPRVSWRVLASGVERGELERAASSTPVLALYRFAPGSIRLRIAHATSTGGISAWRTENPDALLIVNGSYFHEDLLPSGLLVASGTRIGEREFDHDRSGFILGGAHPQIVSNPSSKILNASKEVLQTYPFLIRDGVAAVKEESGKAARRTIIGVDQMNRVVIGVYDEGVITLYELSQLLATLKLDLGTAVNLDGGPSTGLSAKVGSFEELRDSWTAIPNVLILDSRVLPEGG